MIGKTLAHYEVTAKLGQGGMGEVYRAHDTKLGRDVALKILPRDLASDPERVARFSREARTLASLQHPNVASIYGFEEADGIRFLTMELAEGEDLSELLSRRRLSVDEALPIARQIAAALEAAHGKSIVHRDLKPANIKIGADGEVKILDFGLARAYAGDADEGGDPEHSPTITAAMTQAGVILGTAAYMSPEQARGRPTDSRADIWAFGVVLFEMISGQRLFSGETISDTLASVLKTDIDWSLIPDDLPPRVRTLLVRCLDRDRDRRLRDIGEARIVLEDELSGAPDAHLESALHSGMIPTASGEPSTEGKSGLRWLQIVGAVLVGAALALVGARVLLPTQSTEAPLRKLALGIDQAQDPASDPVISPDGRAVAYVTRTDIVVRDLTAREARRFPVSEPAQDLFWSPDGRHLAYIGQQRMYRLDALSGQQQVVCEADDTFTAGSGGSWGSDGTILFSQADTKGFFRVSERGGDPREVLPVDPSLEGDFHDPFVLPENRGVLFVPHKKKQAFETIELWTGDERIPLVELPGQRLDFPVYSATGHILFGRTPTNPGVWAVPFSLDELEVTGEPFLVAPDGGSPSVSDDGTLVYQSGLRSIALRLTWNDASGREVAESSEASFRREYQFPALSRDGQLACALVDDDENPDLWVFDADRGMRTRLTFGSGREEWPMWTPSADAVVCHVRPEGATGIDSMRVLLVPADGRSEPDTLAAGFIPNVSPDGNFVVFSKPFGSGGWGTSDLAYVPRDGDRSQVKRLTGGAGLQMDGQISRDGGFVAYVSSESGEFEIYLTQFPSGEGRWQVSTDGGAWPRWTDDGDRLFYTQGDDIMSVDVTLGASPTLGRPQLAMERPALGVPAVGEWDPGFDVSGDGERFLFFRNPREGLEDQQIVVVQSWSSEFESN